MLPPPGEFLLCWASRPWAVPTAVGRITLLGPASGTLDCDPPNQCHFRTIPTTFWWAIVTITTVGYGDATPTTPLGKVVAGLTMVWGIIVIALPISVLGNNFTKLMQQYSDESTIITQADLDGSGFVDGAEVARWLAAMRKAPSRPHAHSAPYPRRAPSPRCTAESISAVCGYRRGRS